MDCSAGWKGRMTTAEAERRLALIERADRAVREADDGSIGMGDVKRAMSRALRDAQVDLAELRVPSGVRR